MVLHKCNDLHDGVLAVVVLDKLDKKNHTFLNMVENMHAKIYTKQVLSILSTIFA